MFNANLCPYKANWQGKPYYRDYIPPKQDKSLPGGIGDRKHRLSVKLPAPWKYGRKTRPLKKKQEVFKICRIRKSRIALKSSGIINLRT